MCPIDFGVQGQGLLKFGSNSQRHNALITEKVVYVS